MIRYTVQRLILIVFTAILIIFLVFVFIKLLPDYNERVLGTDPQTYELLRQREGYDKPILEQWVIWVRNLLEGQGLGYSIVKGRDVAAILKDKIPVSMRLNIIPYLAGVPIGITLGIIAALKKNKFTDHTISTGVIFFISVPSFVIGTLMQYYVVYVWQWLDTPFVIPDFEFTENFAKSIGSYIMPMSVLLIYNVAGLTRITRAELTEVLTSEFMLLCRTKGLTRGQATFRHGLRNAMVPIAPGIIAGFIYIISGSLIVERIFRVNGIGGEYLEAFNNFDYSFVMGYLMLYTLIGLTAGLIIDLSYGFIDPRIRMGGGKR